jgi:hypothetical protein
VAVRLGRHVATIEPRTGNPFVAALLQPCLARRSESTLGTTDFTAAFIGAAALALLSLGFGPTFRRDAAAEISGHRSKSAEG